MRLVPGRAHAAGEREYQDVRCHRCWLGAGGGSPPTCLTPRRLKFVHAGGRRQLRHGQAERYVQVELQRLHCAAGTKEKPFGYYDATLVGGWQVPGEPYTTAPGSEFMWYRARMLGGRTNHYGRISLRMGPYDFKPTAATVRASTGRSPTTISRPTTTRRRGTDRRLRHAGRPGKYARRALPTRARAARPRAHY